MQNTARRLLVLVATITVTHQIPARAADWNISTPVIVNSGHENDRAVVNTDIKATGVDQAVIRIDTTLGGIKIEQNKSIQTTNGFWDKTTNLITPTTATINIAEGSRLTGSIDNRGYIRSGVNVSGNISPATGSALSLEGTDANNKAVVLQSFTVRDTGYVQSMTDHAINIRQHGFIDFISIEKGGSLRANDVGKSAVYIGQSGMLGGGLAQQISNGDILYYSGNNADPVMNIGGDIYSEKGSGIKIDVGGTVRGAITINGGKVTGSTANGEAAIYIAGDYYGGLVNYGGDIENGIVVSGNHIAATQESPVDNSSRPALEDGDRSAYVSVGGTGKKATLKGGYKVLGSGVVRSGNNHAFYLNDHSTADKIEVHGLLESTSSGKSAIYVDSSAVLGEGGDAIAIYTGGKVRSLLGTAIKVDGNINGKIAVRGGLLKGSNRTGNAIDFSTANTALDFYQDQNGTTIGSILGSTLTTDKMEVLGGSIDSSVISGIENLIVKNATLNTDSLAWASPNTSSLTLNTGADVKINGNFTLPVSTRIEVESGYDPNKILIDVNGVLFANSNKSNLLITPTSGSAYQELLNQGEITIIDYSDGSLDANTSKLLQSSTDGAFKPKLSLLFDVTPDYSETGKVKVKVAPKNIEDIVSGLDLHPELKILYLAFVAASKEVVARDQTKQADAIKTLEQVIADAADPEADTELIITEAIKEFAPTLFRDHDTTSMTVQTIENLHDIVSTRIILITGVASGDDFYGYEGYEDYGDGYYNSEYGPGFSFMDGAVWGQLIYNNSKHDKVEHDSGFKGKTSGFVLGTDIDLTDNYRIGGAGSWSRSSITGDDDSSAVVNNYMASLYSHWQKDGWYTDTIVTIGRGKSDTGKLVLGETVNASYESQFRGLNIIAGHTFSNGVWDISPQGELQIGKISYDVFEEVGTTGTEQRIKIEDYETAKLGFGFRLNLAPEQGYAIRPSYSLMGLYDFKDGGSKIETTYLAAGSTFSVNGPSRDRLQLQTGLGLDIDILDSWTLNTAYNLSWSKYFQSHSFSAKARYDF